MESQACMHRLSPASPRFTALVKKHVQHVARPLHSINFISLYMRFVVLKTSKSLNLNEVDVFASN